jgi:hypothetical protein
MWPCILTNLFVIKPTRRTNFPNLLQHETLHVSGSSSADHKEFIHCTLGTGLCHTGFKTAFEQDQVLLESGASGWFYYKQISHLLWKPSIHDHMHSNSHWTFPNRIKMSPVHILYHIPIILIRNFLRNCLWTFHVHTIAVNHAHNIYFI